MKSLRIATAVIASACALIVPSVCRAMPQQNSQPLTLAEIAREVRAERQKQPQPKIIWTNDNLPKAGGVSTVAPPVAAPEENSAAQSISQTKDEEAVARADKSATQSQLSDELAAAKQKLASLQVGLDIAQKQFTLDQNMFDSNPGRQTDFDGQAKLKRESQQLEAKQQQVADAERQVARLETQLRAAPAAQ